MKILQLSYTGEFERWHLAVLLFIAVQARIVIFDPISYFFLSYLIVTILTKLQSKAISSLQEWSPKNVSKITLTTTAGYIVHCAVMGPKP